MTLIFNTVYLIFVIESLRSKFMKKLINNNKNSILNENNIHIFMNNIK